MGQLSNLGEQLRKLAIGTISADSFPGLRMQW